MECKVRVKSVVSLQSAIPELEGVPLGFNRVGLDGERYVLVRVGGALKIINLAKPGEVASVGMTADAATLTCEGRTVYLAARHTEGPGSTKIQVYNMQGKVKVVDIVIPVEIAFWKWADLTCLVVISPTTVYFIEIPSGTITKAFDIEPTIQPLKLWNFTMDATRSCMLLMGIGKAGGDEGGLLSGAIQCQRKGSSHGKILKAFVAVTTQQHIVYAGLDTLTMHSTVGGGKSSVVSAPLALPPNDFPFSILPYKDDTFVIVVSKEGWVHGFSRSPDGVLTLKTRFSLMQSGGVDSVVKTVGCEVGPGPNPSLEFLFLTSSLVVSKVTVDEYQAALPPPPQSPATTPHTSSRYKIIKKLGQGGQGDVWLVDLIITKGRTRSLTGTTSAALKKIPCRTLEAANFALEEVKSLHEFKSHPGVVGILDFFLEEDKAGGVPYVVCIACEYCPSGDLGVFIEKNNGFGSWERLISWTGQIVTALEALHSNNIIHRDLKPGNLFLTESGDVKIGDFGLARIDDSLAVTQCGTPMFLAPEILAQKPYGSQVDMWSLGCLLYYLIFRKPRALSYQIQSNTNLPYEIKAELDISGCPPNLTAVITSLIRVNPTDRPTASAVRTMLRPVP